MVEELCAVVEKLLAGKVTRAEAQRFAQRTDVGSGVASLLHACVYNLDAELDGAPLIRERDLRAMLALVRDGLRPVDPQPVAFVHRLIAPIGEGTRSPLDGIGWFEEVDRVSPVTGRVFVIMQQIEPRRDRSVIHVLREQPIEDPAALLADARALFGDDVQSAG